MEGRNKRGQGTLGSLFLGGKGRDRGQQQQQQQQAAAAGWLAGWLAGWGEGGSSRLVIGEGQGLAAGEERDVVSLA